MSEPNKQKSPRRSEGHNELGSSKIATDSNLEHISRLQPVPENNLLYRPAHAGKEFQELVESISKDGILSPLEISSDHFILSGHRRKAAAEKAGIEYLPVKYAEITIGDKSQAERVEILARYNRGSRQKTDAERINEALVSVDPEDAIRREQNRKAEAFGMSKASFESVKTYGTSRRTDPMANRREFLDAAVSVLDELYRAGMLPISQRHIQYRLLSLNPLTSSGNRGFRFGTGEGMILTGKTSPGKKRSDALSKLLTDARSAGYIPYNWICDETRPCFEPPQNELGEHLSGQLEGLFCNFWSNVHKEQRNHVEIIFEKNTLLDLIKKHVAIPLRIHITSARGNISAPAAEAVARRFKESGKEKLVVVYASDLDPDGLDMPKSFKKYLLNDHGVDPITIRAGVTQDQVKKYNLYPDFDADQKSKSSRYKRFLREQGGGCYELDSMPMQALINEIKDACLSVLDVEKLNAALAKEQEDVKRLAALQKYVVNSIKEQGVIENLFPELGGAA